MLHEISCNAAISACENDGEKTSALSLLSSTPRMGKIPHETSYSAAISADENDGVGTWALNLLSSMPRMRKTLHEASCSAATVLARMTVRKRGRKPFRIRVSVYG